jgi:hypothetical protein
VQIGAVHPHIFAGQFIGHAGTTLGNIVEVAPGAAPLGWAVAPRFELGYRLPSGFGAIAVSDRFFSTSGTDSLIGPGVATMRTTRITANYTDIDYISREFTPWANWGMTWVAGLRQAETFIGTRLERPFDQAAADGGTFAARASNEAWGMGPHFGVALDRQLGQSGLSFVAKLDIANVFERAYQRFSAVTTTLTPAGRPDHGLGKNIFFQEVPILNYQVGLDWRSPRLPNAHLFVGYLYEMWWQVGTNSTLAGTSANQRLDFNNQGIVFQFGLNF